MAAGFLGYLALALFAPFSLALYALFRPLQATLAVMLTALLLLPERVGFDAPGLPPIDKYALASVCVAVGMLISGQGRALLGAVRGLPRLLVVLAMLGLVGTWYTNRDALQYGPLTIPGLTPREIVSSQAFLLLQMVFPFFAGRALCRRPEDGITLLRALVVASLLYTLPALLEIRLSPQLHRWVYGFHQHQFAQTVRAGGFRPMVFMRHGIPLAMFFMSGTVAAITLHRVRIPVRGVSAGPLAGYLGLVLLACKSMAALIYGLTVGTLVWFTRPRVQVRLAALFVTVSLAYPVLRFVDWFPAEELVDVSARMSADRAGSLAFRFRNEDRLLEKALERPLYGWGREFGRSRVYTEWGNDISVTDGQWIISLGTNGVIGFVSLFLLLGWPVLVAWRRVRSLGDPQALAVMAGLALVTSVHLVDLLPNSLYYHFAVFMSGALLGLAETRGGEGR